MHKGIALETINVEIQRQTNAAGSSCDTSFAVRVDLGRGLTRRERAIMLGSARRCEVYRLLTGMLHFNYGWADKV